MYCRLFFASFEFEWILIAHIKDHRPKTTKNNRFLYFKSIDRGIEHLVHMVSYHVQYDYINIIAVQCDVQKNKWHYNEDCVNIKGSKAHKMCKILAQMKRGKEYLSCTGICRSKWKKKSAKIAYLPECWAINRDISFARFG